MSYFSSSHVAESLSHWMWRRDHKRMEHKRMDIYRIDHRMDHKRRICENTRTSFSTGTVTDRLESHRKYRTPGYGNVFDVEGKSLAVLSLSAFLLILALPHPNSWHRTPLNSCTDWRYWRTLPTLCEFGMTAPCWFFLCLTSSWFRLDLVHHFLTSFDPVITVSRSDHSSSPMECPPGRGMTPMTGTRIISADRTGYSFLLLIVGNYVTLSWGSRTSALWWFYPAWGEKD